MLLHGTLCSSMIFDTLATALYENNYNIIAPDLRGFGLSCIFLTIKNIYYYYLYVIF